MARPTGYAATLTEGALAVAPQAAEVVPGPPDIAVIRAAVCAVLAGGGHVSAAQLLGTGKWTIDGSSLRIEVAGMGKKMLALTVNSEAEKIIRQELQRMGAPTRLLVVPGEGTARCIRSDGSANCGQHSGGSSGPSFSSASAGDLQGRGAQRGGSAPEVNARWE